MNGGVGCFRFKLEEATLRPLPDDGAILKECMDHYAMKRMKDEYLRFFDAMKQKKKRRSRRRPLEQRVK